MGYTLKELISTSELQDFLDSMDEAFAMPTAVIDHQGQILTQSGSRDICRKFHQACPASEKECLKSYRDSLNQVRGSGKSVTQSCSHGLRYSAIPIIVGEKHLGALLMGPFFPEKPKPAFFRKQAAQYGFDKDNYLAAGGKVPVLTRNQLERRLSFSQKLTRMLVRTAFQRWEQLKLGQRYQQLKRIGNVGTFEADWTAKKAVYSEKSDILGVQKMEFSFPAEKTESFFNLVHPEDRASVKNAFNTFIRQPETTFEQDYRIKRPNDKGIRHHHIRAEHEIDENGKITHTLAMVHDISAFKRVEAELHHSKAMLETVLEYIPQRVHWKDPDLRYLGCNSAYLAETGRSNETEILGKSDRELVLENLEGLNQDKLDQILQLAKQMESGQRAAMENDAPELNFEIDFVYRIGKRYWKRASRIPMHDPEGNTIGILVMHENITDRKMAELALEEERLLLRTVMDALPINIYAADNKGRVILINKTLKERAKISPENISDFFDQWLQIPQVAEKHKALIEDCLKGNTLQFQDEFADKHVQELGTSQHSQGTYVPLYGADEKVRGFVMANMDVSELKAMEKALRQKEERFRELYETSEQLNQKLMSHIQNMPMGYIETDSDGLICEWNPGSERIYGYSREEILGKDSTQYIVPEELRPTARKLSISQRRHISPSRVEGPGITKNGKKIQLEVFFTPLFDVRGKLSGTASIINDITAQKDAQAELLQAHETAEEASQAKSRFLANMSHEIRTPMNAIVGLSHLALKTALSPKQAEYLQKIQTSSHNLLNLINDILDFSKIEAGQLELEEKPFHLDQVLHSVAEMAFFRAEAKPVQIQFRTAPDLPLDLKGDPLRLWQVLNNLVENAVKFTESGRIVVTTEPEAREKGHARIRFWVQDTGIGMPPDQMEKLFEPFKQADSSMTRKYGGSGLGLGISKQLVELMGGKLHVESTPGEGSTFSFSIQMRVQSKKELRKFMAPPELQGLKVLVVDQNKAFREIMKNGLCATAFDAVSVGSKKTAVQELKKKDSSYGLVILGLPPTHMFDQDTVQQFKAGMGLSQNLKFIQITAYGHQEEMDKAEMLGVDGVLSKPFSRTTMFNTIMDVFGLSRKFVMDDVDPLSLEPGSVTMPEKARVLLVEDNDINRQVAQEILENMGLVVETAINGQKAVEVLSRDGDRFDTVLMDLQMPIMDGLEATGLIRKQWTRQQLPIIALTAHALETEKNRCLQMGMNDYLSKPVEPDKLMQTLARWIQWGKGTPQGKTDPQMPKHETLDDFPESLPGIDIQRGLKRLNGNQKTYARLLRNFAADYGGAAAPMRNALASNRMGELKTTAHAMKGAAENLSATGVATAIRALETVLKKADSRSIAAKLDALDQELARFIESAKGISRHEKAPEDADTPAEPSNMEITGVEMPRVEITEKEMEAITPILKDMDRLLDKNSLQAMKQFAGLKARLNGQEFQSTLNHLEAALNDLNFKGAKKHLTTIAGILGKTWH